MRQDLNIYGIYVPALLLELVITYALSMLVSRLFVRLDLYRHVWHRALFDLAIFVCLLGGVVYFSSEFLS
ncbi:DUF1656 domain-containing protein [Bradyrhizobium sp. ARR65]|uniref:DUF1656 domain-containing protein n=1 Tax=Bradyrhizobium sp. ARR65 TaxID=1040989 RepID=UPI0004630C04|nr:DUF1656 domain-containing protein [Bradyrhizobium sp. ARR65]